MKISDKMGPLYILKQKQITGTQMVLIFFLFYFEIDCFFKNMLQKLKRLRNIDLSSRKMHV